MANEQKIIDKIISDANNEANEIIRKAKLEADEKINLAKEKAEKQMSEYLNIANVEAEKAASKEISGAEMTAKKMILAKKQEILEHTLKLAKEKLFALPDDEYEKTIFDMIKKVNQSGEIILSDEDRKAFGEKLASEGYNVSSETRDIGKGFIIKKGDIEYNYSFNSIIEVEKESIEQKATEILFG